MQAKPSILDALFKQLSSIRNGIILLILLVITAIVGTLIVQKPLARPGELERIYAPETLRLLNFFGLLDVFHSWWFTALLALLILVIIFASLERFPIAWRYFAHPYRFPEDHFVRNLPLQATVPFSSLTQEEALARVGEAFRRRGFNPIFTTKENATAIFAEKHRFSRLAPYVIHLSLLMIFGGAMVDALWGYRAFMALTPGETAQEAERLANSTNLQLPFAIRCEDTGQENYPDGSPKRWWSRLIVLDHGKEVLKKEIAVNDPLTYRGVRFFQAGYGSTGQAREVTLVATHKDRGGERRLALVPGVPTPLDDHGATVTLVAFVPDFIVRGNQIIAASEKPTNPAIELLVEEPNRGPRSTPRRAGAPVTVRLFPAHDPFPPPNPSSYRFLYQGVEMIPYTGLQLAHEPGQWLIWAGCITLTLGLALAFYFVHIRFWALPIYGESAVADRTIPDDRGQLAPSRSPGAGLTMWMGGSASKNREDFEIRFRELVNEVRHALPPPSV